MAARGETVEAAPYFDLATAALTSGGMMQYRLECLRAAATNLETLGSRERAKELRGLVLDLERQAGS